MRRRRELWKLWKLWKRVMRVEDVEAVEAVDDATGGGAAVHPRVRRRRELWSCGGGEGCGAVKL